MTGKQLQRAREIFEKLVDTPRDQRRSLLANACEDEPHLRDFVERLLANDESGMGDFLRPPAGASDTRGTESEVDSMPRRIGRYKIIRVVGEGGMGIVYEAQQENPSRRVALKVIRAGLAAGQMLKRFQRETDLLGQLQHPGIAQIYEAGAAEMTTESGVGARQPYLAMELIHGRPLNQYVEGRSLRAPARLELVARICDAVQHAHRKGVIHRDLKPGNILVDESGQPKILDFGVARVTDADVRTVTLRTDVGQLIGTIPYMSPEQVSGDSRRLDTRSDVYSLGVILFEVLAGRLPHDVRTTSIPEAVRRIRDDEPVRLGSVNRSLRGEVEIIVSKALEKDPAHRYQSASDLAIDIRRHLHGEPIEARRHSSLYVLKKTMMRYRFAALAVALLVAVLFTFGIVSYIQAEKNQRLAVKERTAREKATAALALAQREQKRADVASTHLQAELTSSNIERGRLLGSKGDLFAAEDLIWREHLRNPTSDHSYWALWELYLRNPSLATLGTQQGHLHAMSFAPDGRLVASAGSDGVIMLWDSVTLKHVGTLAGHKASVNGLAFSPDGRLLTSGSVDGTLITWDVVTRAPLHTWQGETDAVRSICYSPDGRHLLCGTDNGSIHIWNATAHKTEGTLRGHTGSIWNLQFSPDGTLLASGSGDNTIRIWRNLAGPEVATLSGHTHDVSSLAFSPDGRQLASGSGDKTIRLWNLATFACTDRIDADNGTIRFLKYSKDGKSLFVGGWWRIDAWDLTTRSRRTLAPHGVTAADIRSDRSVLARGCEDIRLFQKTSVRLVDVGSDAGVFNLERSAGHWPATVSSDGRLIAASDNAGGVRIWETATGRILKTLQSSSGRRLRCHFHPAGKILALCGPDVIEFWNVSTTTLINRLSGHHAVSTHSLTFSPDGSMFAATWQDGTIRICAVPSGKVITTIPAHENEALSVRFSPDGQTLAVSYRWGMIRWYSVQGELLSEFDAVLTPWTTAFSPDGRKLAAACWARQIQVWDLTSRALELRLEASTAVIWEVAYMPGHSNLVTSCSDDGTVQLWDLLEHRNVATFGRFDGPSTSVSFTPDGKTLVATGRGDEPIRVWDLEYYDRHIAGNLENQITFQSDALGDEMQTQVLRAWAADVLRRPWPRIGPRAASDAEQPLQTGAAAGRIDADTATRETQTRARREQARR